MSRFAPTDPFYAALAQAESDDFTARIVRADAERFRRACMALPLTTPITDHDPGDEDRS